MQTKRQPAFTPIGSGAATTTTVIMHGEKFTEADLAEAAPIAQAVYLPPVKVALVLRKARELGIVK